MKTSHPWNKLTLPLHAVLASAIILQVGLILFREATKHQVPFLRYRALAIEVHQYLGVFLLFIALFYLIYPYLHSTFSGKATPTFSKIFSRENLLKIKADLACLILQRKLPIRTEGQGLAASVQMLGLLLVFGLAGFGTLALICGYFPHNALLTQWGKSLIQIHKFFAGLIWWYLGGHIGMALLHRILPDRFHQKI